MKLPKTFSLWLLIAWVCLAIVDMWFDVVSTPVFIKLSVTIGLLMIIVLALSIAKRGKADDPKQ